MNGIYPLSSVIIMDDDIYELYGGDSIKGTDGQRAAAYFIAEEAVSRDISTLLLPVIVTGTYTWDEYAPQLVTDWAYVHQIYEIRFIDTEGDTYYTISGTDNVYASIRDQEYGIIDIHQLWRNCNCSSSTRPFPYQVQMVYQAGLPTGTANYPNMLLALSTYSDIVLNEIMGYGNEAAGGVGVQEFTNQSYREVRTKLGKTGFGSSARAQFVSSLLTSFRKHRYVKLGW